MGSKSSIKMGNVELIEYRCNSGQMYSLRLEIGDFGRTIDNLTRENLEAINQLTSITLRDIAK